jgi:Tfp pilus assembly protein PilW
VVARIRARLAQEDGMTLIELLTTLGILAFVLTAILGMFVSGLSAEVDMNNRFQAQQNARLALTSMRQDIREACALSGVKPLPPGTPSSRPFWSNTVTLGYSCTPAAPSGSSQVTWCVQPISANDYGLYREVGATCSSATGVKEADQLTSDLNFATLAQTSSARPELQVWFPVDANTKATGGAYNLNDVVMLRNAPAS